MPSGRTHDIITAASTPIVAPIAHQITGNIEDTIILICSYIFASLMFNGDLDIKSRPYRRWLLLKWIWYPYRNMFFHRSIWTHGIIIGTIIRLLYLLPLFYILYNLFNIDLTIINWYYGIIILIGLELGNIMHTLSDKMISD